METFMFNLGMSSIISLLIFTLVLIIVYLGVKIVSQSEVFVVERFGKYTKTLSAGLNLIVPYLDKVAHKVDILERQLPEKENSVITKDNVEILLKTAVFYRIIDASRAVYRISNIDQAIETAVIGVIRAVCGAMEFDDVQAKRDVINQKIEETLSVSCADWGIQVTRTEVLDVDVDANTKTAMQQQLNAERERRAVVRGAEGEKEAKQLQADAELYTAQKLAEAKRTLADADAYSTTVVAEAIKKGGQPAIDFEIVKKQVEAIEKLSQSPNSKLLILPTDVTKVLGSLQSIVEVMARK
jgi:regulator of protease activity HflC (stomatin/prohibitin superfamily)